MVFTQRFRAHEPEHSTDLPHVAEMQAYRQAMLLDETVTKEQHVVVFKMTLGLLTQARKRLAPIAKTLTVVSPVLNDPQHANHPNRSMWQAQYDDLCRQEDIAAELVVVQVWHLHAIWQHFIPYERRDYGMDALVGIHCAVKELGRDIAFIDAGPIQDDAPLPEGYEPPPEFFARLAPNFRLMLNHCLF